VNKPNNRVGINTGLPSCELDVVGTAKISGNLIASNRVTTDVVYDSQSRRRILFGYPGSGYGDAALYFDVPTSCYVVFQGDLGQGVVPWLFTIDPSGNCTTRGVLYQTSDIRFKENIIAIDSPIEKIMQMRGVYFNTFIEKDRRRIGVIAQEIEQVLPEVVFTDRTEDKHKSVAYGDIIAILIEGIKEQQSTIQSQAEEIASLKTSYNTLISTLTAFIPGFKI